MHQITKEVAAEHLICKNVKEFYEDLENEKNKNAVKSNSDTDIQCTDICPSVNNKLFDGRIEKNGTITSSADNRRGLQRCLYKIMQVLRIHRQRR